MPPLIKTKTMNPIFFIEYIDALYFFDKEEFTFKQFTVHSAIGKLIVFENHIELIYKEKKNTPVEGLLLPKNALILKGNEKKSNLQNLDFSNKINSDVGIYWSDIVHFVNEGIPDKCTQMYSEGQLFRVTYDAVIIKNPLTIIVNNKHLKKHPNEKISFIVIPKSFITNVDFYEKNI